jgi:hypothetical protein
MEFKQKIQEKRNKFYIDRTHYNVSPHFTRTTYLTADYTPVNRGQAGLQETEAKQSVKSA